MTVVTNVANAVSAPLVLEGEVTNVPSSLIIVALVVAWLVVLVPMIARKRQEVVKTTDTALASRIVRSGEHADVEFEEEFDMDHVDESETVTADEPEDEDYEEVAEARPYRPGRGGYDAEAAAVTARAKYAFRQRMVLLMLLAAVVSAGVAALVMSVVWWAHGAVDLLLVGYLVYLRRQVRIEAEIRERRQARVRHARAVEDDYDEVEDEPVAEQVVHEAPRQTRPAFRPRPAVPGTVVVDIDDEAPDFEDLDMPMRRPYRRAVGE